MDVSGIAVLLRNAMITGLVGLAFDFGPPVVGIGLVRVVGRIIAVFSRVRVDELNLDVLLCN